MSIEAPAVKTDSSIARTRELALRVVREAPRYAAIVFLVGLLIVVSIIFPGFWEVQNIKSMLISNAPIGLVAVGMTFALLTGQFDLSVGALLAAGAVFYAELSNHTSLPAALAACVLLGIAFGVVTGLVVTKLRINSLVATLGLGAVYSAAVYQYSHSNPISVSFGPGWNSLGFGELAGFLPWAILVLLAFYIVGEMILSKTVFGRWVRATGGNGEASRLAGLPVDRVKLLAFVIVGVCSVLAGAVTASQLGVGQATMGTDTPLSAFAIVVIGGTSVYGGEGAIWRTFIGLLIIVILGNTFNHFALEHYVELFTSGIVLVAALGLDAIGRRRA